MTALAKRIAIASICGLSIASSPGCERRADVDRSRLTSATGAGGQDSPSVGAGGQDGATTSAIASSSSSAGGGSSSASAGSGGAIAATEPDDTAATASGPFTPHALIKGAITPGSDVDYFEVVLTATADLEVETFDGDGPGSCAGIDTVVTLFAPDGTTALATADDGGIAACSRLDPAIDAGARRLAAGAYFVKVEDFGNNTLIPAYTLELTLASLCGDGKIEGSEECEGGAGCTATCERVPVCGDGLLDAPEACDDGNTLAGDGCGATCLFEATAEVEPNGTLADATVKITGSTWLSGAILPALDQDYAQLILAQPTVVRLETFDASGHDCAAIATTLRLWDGAGAPLYADDNSGIFTCSALVAPLPAGSYFVSIEQRTGALAIPAYLLQATFEASAGLEGEPNEATTQATAILGADAFARGDHAGNSDRDFFAITVPAGKSLRVEVIEGDAETCESDGVDSLLTLFDEGGVELGSDDDSGRGFCSRIDGTGSATTAAEAYAHNLAGGTYYVLVEAAETARDPADASGQFAYRLAVTVR